MRGLYIIVEYNFKILLKIFGGFVCHIVSLFMDVFLDRKAKYHRG